MTRFRQRLRTFREGGVIRPVCVLIGHAPGGFTASGWQSCRRAGCTYAWQWTGAAS